MGDSQIPIHLVLGSGGARGLTHIGVIRVLQEQGYSIKSITGCSMGALVGALLVSGHLDEYEDWVSQLTRWDVLRFLDISLLGRSGMVKGDRLIERLSQWLSGIDMESLPVPLTVVAADIASRKEVWISKGDLMEAVRASIAVPGVFSPLVTHGRVLVDGGILNPLPIPPTRMDTDTITVAVSLSGRESTHPYGDAPVLVEPEEKPVAKESKRAARKRAKELAKQADDALSAQLKAQDNDEAGQPTRSDDDKKLAALAQTEVSSTIVDANAGLVDEPGSEAEAEAALVTDASSAQVEQAALAKATTQLVASAADKDMDKAPEEGTSATEDSSVDHQPIESFLDSLQRFFGRDRSGDNGSASEASSNGETSALASRQQRLRSTSRPALTDVMLGMFNTMQDTIARHQLASNPPDILIDIPCNICQSHEYHKAKDLIPAGAYWARRALVDQVDNARR